MVREVFGTAFSSKARATTPGEVRHRLVAHLVSGSEHRAVPGPGPGEGRVLCLWAGDPAPCWDPGPLSRHWQKDWKSPSFTAPPASPPFLC